MAMINIVIFERSIKRKVVLNLEFLLINLSRCGMPQLWSLELSTARVMTTASEIQVKSDIIRFILPRSWTFHKAQIVILQLYKWYITIA